LFARPQPQSRRYLDRHDRPRRLKAQFFAILTLLAGAGYLLWVHWALNWAHPVVAGLFLAAEIACLSLFVLATQHIWRLRFKPPEGLPAVEPYSVDVFIATCGEPFRIVATTLRAAAAMDWNGPVLTSCLFCH